MVCGKNKLCDRGTAIFKNMVLPKNETKVRLQSAEELLYIQDTSVLLATVTEPTNMTILRLFRTQALVQFLLVILAFTARPVSAATVPTGFSEALIASGLASPTAMQFAPDGRLF